MSTSGVITSTLTAREIITRALQRIAVVSPGETPTDDEATDALVDLNLLLKSMQVDANAWRETTDTYVATTAETTLDPRVIDVSEARVVTGYDRPLFRWEWGDYQNISNKAQVGVPSCYVIRRSRNAVSMFLWPVPTSSTIKYTAQRVIEDAADLDEEIDVPQAWLECIILNLALILAPGYGADVPRLVSDRAALLLRQMQDMDRPASYYLRPA